MDEFSLASLGNLARGSSGGKPSGKIVHMISSDEEKLLRIGIETVLQPWMNALDNVFGPTSEHLGLVIRDMFCAQLQNVGKVYGRALELLAKVGLKAGPVQLKILKAILEGASSEEDPDLQENGRHCSRIPLRNTRTMYRRDSQRS